jgi:diguanylate cyclase (GGDEF)-like protein
MGRRWRLYRKTEPRRGLPTALALTAIFSALALFTRFACQDAAGTSSFWPANAALVVAILVLPPRLSSLTSAACFTINLLLNAATDYLPANSLLYSALNIFVSYLAAFLTRSLCGSATDFSRFTRLAMFAGIAFVSAGVEAAVGVLPEKTLPSDPPPWLDWLQWSLCDGFGLLIGTPAILLAIRRRQHDEAGYGSMSERCALLAGCAGVTLAGFYFAHSAVFLLVYPLLVLTAFRAGPPWVLTSVLLASIAASAMTAHGYGPLVLLSVHGAALREDLVQPFLISLFLVAIPSNSALGEKMRAARRMQLIKASAEHDATHDQLTGLANRGLFQRIVRNRLESGQALALLLLDMDRFKQVNDTMGHLAGDQLLRAFSARLVDVAGPAATVARLGGDEFALLLPPGNAASSPESLCRAITVAARAPFDLFGKRAHISVSVGVALALDGLASAEELMRKADIALYAAKSAGRDGYRIFTQDLDSMVCDRAGLEADLRVALATGTGLSLHYQLKTNRAGQFTGVEALARWNRPGHGPVGPDLFIPIAEESGLIIDLGNWVFAEALAFAARWRRLKVAINVSPVQLRHSGFIEETRALLAASLVSPDQVELEVTETALLESLPVATDKLAILRDLGVRIALDDFGTGYSSLRHLHRFTVDRLKIDRSFVQGLGDGDESAAIIHAVIQLGHAMGLQVTAEGVETSMQRDFLVEAGVDELQGFFVARPMDEAEIAASLRAGALAAIEVV